MLHLNNVRGAASRCEAGQWVLWQAGSPGYGTHEQESDRSRGGQLVLLGTDNVNEKCSCSHPAAGLPAHDGRPARCGCEWAPQ